MDTQTKRPDSEKAVLLVGATGGLGGLIAQALLDKGVKCRLLVRPGSRSKLAVAIRSGVVEDEAVAFDNVSLDGWPRLGGELPHAGERRRDRSLVAIFEQRSYGRSPGSPEPGIEVQQAGMHLAQAIDVRGTG